MKTLADLFGKARTQGPEVPVDEIRLLIDSSKLTPLAFKKAFHPRRINRLFNPLKILVMITPIVIITSLFIVFNPGKSEKPAVQETVKQTTVENTVKSMGIPVRRNNEVIIGPGIRNATSDSEQDQIPVIGPGVRKNNLHRPASDTTFLGLLFSLSKEQLSRLGFLFDDEGYYYLNKLPNGSYINFWSRQSNKGGEFGFGAGASINPRNKQTATHYDFYPVVLTNLKGENPRSLDQAKSIAQDSFELMNDTLVPIIFRMMDLGGYRMGDMLVWFKVSDPFFDLLGSTISSKTKSRVEVVKALSDAADAQKNRIVFDYYTAAYTIKTIKLSPEIFTCLGFHIASDSVEYTFNSHNMWLTTSVFGHGISVQRHMTMDSVLASQEKAILYFITRYDEGSGNSRIGSAFGNSKTYSQDIDLCIPVSLDDLTMPPFVRNAIFWIYPNEKFFSCLPPEIAEPMRAEFKYHTELIIEDFVPVMGGSKGIGSGRIPDDTAQKKSDPVPCIYFTNLCEELPGLDFVNLYPNPADQELNVDLTLQKAKKIHFRVFDLGGRMLTDLGEPTNFPDGGQFTQKVDVSGLTNGIYLLVMTDDEGAKLTRRFVKN